MKIDMTSPILDISGVPVKDVTLRTIVQTALLTTTQADVSLPGEKKARMFSLAIEANKDKPNFSVEDLQLIKERVGMVATPLAVGRAFEILDPPA